VTDVGIGTAIVAYIEAQAGQAQAFNRWYERDHMYASITAGPGAFSGARWIATRACKAVRPSDATWFGEPTRGSFLTTVWVLDGLQSQWDGWVRDQMEVLGAQPDRMFSGRDHLHTAVYGYAGEQRTPAGVSAATALDHPFVGVTAVAVPPGAGAELAAALVGPQIPTTVTFTPTRVILADADAPPHDLVFGFSAGDPIESWHGTVAPILERLPSVGFASPFVRTIPGTDTYIDEL
jgi:hypothetical protein